MYQRDNAVIRGVDQPLDIERQMVEVLRPGAHVFADTVAPAIAVGSRKAAGWNPLNIVSENVRVEYRIEVATLQRFSERLEPPPHDLDVLLRHRLLPQPGGFEGFLAVVEVLLADDPPRTKGEEREQRTADVDTAAPATRGYLPAHEQPVPRVDHLLKPNVRIPGIVHRQPHLPIALVTAIHALQIRDCPAPALGPPDLDGRVVSAEGEVEVPAIRGGPSPADQAREEGPPDAGARPQMHDRGDEARDQRRKADIEALIEGAAAPGCTRGPEWGAHDLAARHHLLPQPGGFEGGFPFGERAPLANLPFLEQVHREHAHLDLCAASLPSPANPFGNHDHVASIVEDLVERDLELLPSGAN